MNRKAFTHYLLITLLLLSQWFTVSAMACPLVTSNKQTVATAATQNSNEMPCHDMAQANTTNHQHNNSHQDCCDNNCHCPSGACFSGLMINTKHVTLSKMTNLLVEHQPFSSQTSSIKQQQKPPQIV